MVTMQQIADHVGVSKSTVSRVLANKPNISSEVRQRVLAAAKELGYLSYSKIEQKRHFFQNKIIGALLPGIHNPHFSQLLYGISDLAYDHQMTLVLCNTVASNVRENFYIQQMHDEKAVGIIISPHNNQDKLCASTLDRLRRQGVAVVVFDNEFDDYVFDSVQVDNYQGMLAGVTHLIHLGYKRIGIITGKLNTKAGSDRLRGYVDAMRKANLSIEPQWIAHGDWEYKSAYYHTERFLRMTPPPQAIVACNNTMTLALVNALRKHEIRIPQQIAVLGFDDPPWAESMYPALTTIAQPTYAIGREVMRLLVRRLQEPNASTLKVTLPARLIIRESCGSKAQEVQRE